MQQKSQFARRIVRVAALSAAVSAILALTAREAFAAITINGVANASVWDNKTITATNGGTIYGGFAGFQNVTATGTGVYDSCAALAALIPCNTRMVFPNLSLSISVSSTTVNGYGYIVKETTGDSSTPRNINTTVPTGNSATIAVTWGQICSSLSVGQDCEGLVTGSATEFSGTYRVGFSKAADNNLGTDDDYIVVTIRPSYYVGQGTGTGVTGNESFADRCDSETTGLCHYEVAPGDEKVILRNIRGNGSFPSNSPLSFRWVRFFYQQGDITSFAKATLNSADTFVDAEVSRDEQTNEVDITPARLTGLANDVTYVFRAASVDQAGNVGYFVADAEAVYCDYARRTTNCHVATPGEVYGVLGEDVNCFVATAAWGSNFAPHVATLRNFRDTYLLTNEFGKKLNRIYYDHSPRMATFIAKNETLRALSRVVLWPFALFASLALQIGIYGALVAALLSLAAVFAGSRAALRVLSRVLSKSTRGACA